MMQRTIDREALRMLWNMNALFTRDFGITPFPCCIKCEKAIVWGGPMSDEEFALALKQHPADVIHEGRCDCTIWKVQEGGHGK